MPLADVVKLFSGDFSKNGFPWNMFPAAGII